MILNPIEQLGWWHDIQPTREELYLSGGLLVEDWPHARQVVHLSRQMFEATRPLHHFDALDLRMLERAALLHNTVNLPSMVGVERGFVIIGPDPMCVGIEDVRGGSRRRWCCV